MLKAAPASTCRSRKTAGWWTAKGLRWNWTTNDRWAGHQHSPKSGWNPCPWVPAIGPALPLAGGPMLTNLTWRNVAVPIAALVIASGCIARGIIIANDRPELHKAAVTQKVLPL